METAKPQISDSKLVRNRSGFRGALKYGAAGAFAAFVAERFFHIRAPSGLGDLIVFAGGFFIFFAAIDTAEYLWTHFRKRDES